MYKLEYISNISNKLEYIYIQYNVLNLNSLNYDKLYKKIITIPIVLINLKQYNKYNFYINMLKISKNMLNTYKKDMK